MEIMTKHLEVLSLGHPVCRNNGFQKWSVYIDHRNLALFRKIS